MNNVLDIKQLSVDFMTPQGSRNTVNDVNLTIAPGETLCLVGESGSGKTITSLSVMRLIEYDNGHITKGSVSLNGLNLAELSRGELRKLRGKKIAMIFQEPMTALADSSWTWEAGGSLEPINQAARESRDLGCSATDEAASA
ncbi:ATP-binding cassette domain-containing protein [Cohnella abietis]|uniref:ABC transporter domain-containing protein n=1 Tax=Cohnella abietis TaxID=2507935 RepID=A0A3T1DB69_9BACL|nr:hypothetical protein KCTCHS21_46270 [Cohnella abietis]